jgi:hypothetical protein
LISSLWFAPDVPDDLFLVLLLLLLLLLLWCGVLPLMAPVTLSHSDVIDNL